MVTIIRDITKRLRWKIWLRFRRKRGRRRTWAAQRVLFAVMSEKAVKAFFAAPCPTKVCGREVPQNLEHITFADLVALQTCETYEQLAAKSCQLLLGCDETDVLRLPAYDVAGITRMVGEALKGIAEQFAACEVEPTQQERRAKPPKGDWFSTVDWYARRMGFTDHNAAINVNWKYYLRCAMIDAEQTRYERRLLEVQNQEMKSKIKKK